MGLTADLMGLRDTDMDHIKADIRRDTQEGSDFSKRNSVGIAMKKV